MKCILSVCVACLVIPAVSMTAQAEIFFEITYVDNAAMDFASRGWLSSDSDFQANMRAGTRIWAEVIDSDEAISIEVSADAPGPRFGGSHSNGRFLGTDGNGNDIFEPGPLSRILTATNPGGPIDIFIDVNSTFLDNNYWIDPTPEDRSDQTPPIGMTDLVSIVMHEMGHALGVNGTRRREQGPNYGTFPGFVNPFDVMSYFGGNGDPLDPSNNPNPMFFNGANAVAVFGSDVPLSHVGPGAFLASQDFYHFACDDSPVLTGALMTACTVPDDGTILYVTRLDLALIKDIGYPVVRDGDSFMNAITIGDGELTGTLLDATNDGENGLGFVGQPDVWYRYSVPGAGVLSVDTCGSFTLGTVDTTLSLHPDDSTRGTQSDYIARNDGNLNAECIGFLDSALQHSFGGPRDILIRVSQYQPPPGPFVLRASFSPANNSDGDGFFDSMDNCTLVANPNQRDTDADGYGNFCDPDFDNSGSINFNDLSVMRAVFFTSDPAADLDGSGSVNFADLSIMRAMFFGQPGPSGLVP